MGDNMDQLDVKKKTYMQLHQHYQQVRLASPLVPPRAHLQLTTACRGADGRQARHGFDHVRGHRRATATWGAAADGPGCQNTVCSTITIQIKKITISTGFL